MAPVSSLLATSYDHLAMSPTRLTRPGPLVKSNRPFCCAPVDYR
jgi:hypothetical protein